MDDRFSEIVREKLGSACRKLDIPLSNQQSEKMTRFACEVIRVNQKFNLTRISDPMEFAIKHLADSLLVTKLGLANGRGIDIGTGAGFPGIPLAIYQPTVPMTLVDSLAKRVAFLEEMISVLDLPLVKAVHGRAEELGSDKDYRSHYDWAVARAVAPLAVLLEYCIPFLRVGGRFVAMKTQSIAEELDAGQRAGKKLGVTLQSEHQFELPEGQGERSLVSFIKETETPDRYPRRAGIPSKKPL